MQKTILVIDTEDKQLNDVANALRKEQFLVHYVTDFAAARMKLMNIHFDLSVTFLDPEAIETFEFVRRMVQEFQQVVRIAVCDYTDTKLVDDLIIEHAAKLYMFKPWDKTELVEVILRIYDFRARLGNENLLSLIHSVKQLPTLPDLYYDITAMVNAGSNMRDIALKIETDPAIASRVLKIANSAYYGARTGSILQAIMYLGTDNIQNIILTSTFFNAHSPYYQINRLWKHSELTNRIVNHLYYYKHQVKIPASHASIGLLHNIGLLMLIVKFPDIFNTIINTMRQDKTRRLIAAERQHAGYTHCDLGGYIMEWWNLPVGLIACAKFYDNPTKACVEQREYVAMVHLASYLAWDIIGKDELTLPLDLAVYDILGISAIEVGNIKEQHQTLNGQ